MYITHRFSFVLVITFLSRTKDQSDESLNGNGNGKKKKKLASDKILLHTVNIHAIIYNLIRKIFMISTNLFNT